MQQLIDDLCLSFPSCALRGVPLWGKGEDNTINLDLRLCS